MLFRRITSCILMVCVICGLPGMLMAQGEKPDAVALRVAHSVTPGTPDFKTSEKNFAGFYKIAVGGSKIFKLPQDVKRVSLGNSGIADYTIISKDEILVLGVKVGKTEMHIWTDAGFNSYVVNVYDDILELMQKLSDIMGDWVMKAVSVHVVKETAVLKGIVSSTFQSEQIEKISALYYAKILNLIEVKSKEPKPSLSKKMEPENSSQPKAEILPAGAVPVGADPSVASLLPKQVGNLTDIVELDTINKIRMNENSYGAGAANEEYVQTRPLSSQTISADMLKKADSITTRIVVLQNSSSKDLAALLNSNGVKSIDGQIYSDDRTNSLVIVDKPSMIEKIVNMIKVLDSEVPQVLIEAKIIEVDLTDNMSNTMSWIYDTLYSNASSGMNNKTFSFDNTGLTMKVDYGKISSDHFNSTILPKLTKLHARLLSSPSTITLDRKKATFFVKDKIPYLVITQQVNNGISSTSNSTQFIEPEIRLEATPLINQNDHIKMDLHVKVETFIGLEKLQDGSSAPKTNVRDTTNIVEVKNNETIIISGFIQSRVNRTATKVPVISKIPFIGSFFSNKNNETVRTELVIFVTPKIIGKNSAYGKVDKEKFPRVAENKFPNVDEKFTTDEIFGEDEEHPVQKKVDSDFVIPKATEILPQTPAAAVKEPVLPLETVKSPAPVVKADLKIVEVPETKSYVYKPDKDLVRKDSEKERVILVAPVADKAPLPVETKKAAPAAEVKKAAAPVEEKKAPQERVKVQPKPAEPVLTKAVPARKKIEMRVDNSPIRDPKMQVLIEGMRKNLIAKKTM